MFRDAHLRTAANNGAFSDFRHRADKVWHLRQTALLDWLGESKLHQIAELSLLRESSQGVLILGPNSDPDLI